MPEAVRPTRAPERPNQDEAGRDQNTTPIFVTLLVFTCTLISQAPEPGIAPFRRVIHRWLKAWTSQGSVDALQSVGDCEHGLGKFHPFTPAGLVSGLAWRPELNVTGTVHRRAGLAPGGSMQNQSARLLVGKNLIHAHETVCEVPPTRRVSTPSKNPNSR